MKNRRHEGFSIWRGASVSLSYATRRADSIQSAQAILKRAEGLHPKEPTIQFNLAGYEAQMSNLAEAKANQASPTRIEPKFRLLALDEPDLEPIWASLAAD